MDRSLDEIISERPQRGGRRGQDTRRAPPPRGPRREREEYPRDGVRKPLQNRRDERTNIENDWVHDRFDDRHDEDRYDRRRGPAMADDYAYDRRAPERPAAPVESAKIRVENLHYDLTEDDIHELFTRIGPVAQARLLYDRMDRSQGTAFVTYEDPRDARLAVREYDGANASGQPIRLSLLPAAPVADRGAAKAPGSLFDRVERPSRSLFERIDNGPASRDDDMPRRRGGRGDRSFSPRKDDGRSLRVPENVDRYVPGQRDSRSPIGGRRGGLRERGRRPGARREDSGRGAGRRGGRTDEEGRPVVGGRPKKTAEELDAEMEDYWGGNPPAGAAQKNGAAAPAQNGGGAAPAAAAAGDDDIDMIE